MSETSIETKVATLLEADPTTSKKIIPAGTILTVAYNEVSENFVTATELPQEVLELQGVDYQLLLNHLLMSGCINQACKLLVHLGPMDNPTEPQVF